MADKLKIFVDINVLLDIMEERKGVEASLSIVGSIRAGLLEGYISALTVAILYFLRLKEVSDQRARAEVKKAMRNFEIVDLTSNMIMSAIDDKRFKDFEDAIQFHSVKDKAKIFITRNKKDFKAVKDEIELLIPEEFLKKYQL